MTELFEYVPHPHLENRKESGPTTVAAVRAHLHGDSKIAQLNGKIGLKITLIVGTMWAAYLFTVLALVSAPSAFSSGNLIVIVAWIAQTFLQLVLLPIIIVGQNVQAAAADHRAQATYDDAVAILEEARQIQAHLKVQDEALLQLHEHLVGSTAPQKAPRKAPRKSTQP